MTILNQASEGLYPEVIVLARLVATCKSITREDLLEQCAWGETTRLSGALSRWSALGLFVEHEGAVQLDEKRGPRRGESIDAWTIRLPSMLREIALKPDNCEPLFGHDVGTSADFVRGVAWLLAQDIFAFPTTWTSGAEEVERAQLRGEKIVQNDTRWNGLRSWARYLGFATGDARNFRIDPTEAIREELITLQGKGRGVPAGAFVAELSSRLPVLDGGTFRFEVEKRLDESAWRKPESLHLSMSLSFALRRLEVDHVLALETRADAADAIVLTSKGFRSGQRFTHVRFVKAKP